MTVSELDRIAFPDQLTADEKEALIAALTRRGLISTAAGLALLTGTPIRTGAQTPGPGWSFTDDAGDTIELDEMPTRVVAFSTHAAGLADFGIITVGTWSWVASNPENFGPEFFGRLDLDTQQLVGNAEGRIDMEKLLVADPDLIVTTGNDPDLDALREVAPVVVINFGRSADLVVARIEEFAAALGADLTTPSIVEAKTRFETTVDELQAILADKPDVTALFIFAGEAELWVANPEVLEQISLLVRLGMTIVKPEVEEGAPWEALSMEQALRYECDVLFQSSLATALTPEQLTAHPLFSHHPAVMAGQIGLWNNEYIRSYQGALVIVQGALDAFRNARNVI